MLVSKVHLECVGESRSVLSTLDKLKRIELKMEMLTKELEQMPAEKVAIAQRVRRDEMILIFICILCSNAQVNLTSINLCLCSNDGI